MKIDLEKDQKKVLYDEIVRITDLTENVLDVIEEDAPGDDDTNFKVKLATPVLEEMNKSGEVIADIYLKWVENDEEVSKNDVKTMESALRNVFTVSTDFFKKIQEISNPPSSSVKIVSEKVKKIFKNMKLELENSPLPRIGNGKGELKNGKFGKAILHEIGRLPKFINFIQAMMYALDQFFRLTYCFFRLNNKLVSTPDNVIWGRQLADLDVKNHIEKSYIDITRGNGR